MRKILPHFSRNFAKIAKVKKTPNRTGKGLYFHENSRKGWKLDVTQSFTYNNGPIFGHKLIRIRQCPFRCHWSGANAKSCTTTNSLLSFICSFSSSSVNWILFNFASNFYHLDFKMRQFHHNQNIIYVGYLQKYPAYIYLLGALSVTHPYLFNPS